MPPRIIRLSQEKESREILAVALDRPLQNPRAIDVSGDCRRDRSRIAKSLFYNHLHTAGGIVERHPLDLRVGGKEIQALIQSNRMRISPLDLREFDLIWRDQIMHNSYAGFSNDR